MIDGLNEISGISYNPSYKSLYWLTSSGQLAGLGFYTGKLEVLQSGLNNPRFLKIDTLAHEYYRTLIHFFSFKLPKRFKNSYLMFNILFQSKFNFWRFSHVHNSFIGSVIDYSGWRVQAGSSKLQNIL